uniref:Carrier domain-containing protein n=1 Tax=Poecilia mexicana TaxID=48701 RepID=A0A3B3WX26_9TELE
MEQLRVFIYFLLSHLFQLILSLPQVEACAVGLYKEYRLLAFVVASASEVHLHQGEPEGAGRDLQRLILKQLSLLVSAHCIPDALVLLHSDDTFCHQDTLGLPADASIDERSNFLFSGGDSLKALRLCEDILAAMGVSSPRLLEVILDRSFSEVLRHVTQMLPLEPDGSSSSKKRAAEAPSGVPAKKGPRSDRTQQETLGCKVVRRGGEVQGTNFRSVDAGEEEPLDGKDVGVRLGTSWSSDTGRCVDASPVILVRDVADEQSRATVFIGSHSHRIQALDLAGGNLLWERVLGDKIEASAAVSHCGSLVVVGQCRFSECFSDAFVLLDHSSLPLFRFLRRLRLLLMHRLWRDEVGV